MCATRTDSARAAAIRFGATYATSRYEELLDDPELDLVAVCVRPSLHGRIVEDALAAGKHVYCEWPLGVSAGESSTLATLGNLVPSLHAAVGLQARADPTLLQMRSLIQGGYVGDVTACHMTMFIAGLLPRALTKPWAADARSALDVVTVGAGHALDAFSFAVSQPIQISSRASIRVSSWPAPDGVPPPLVTAADDVVLDATLANHGVLTAHIAFVPWAASGWRLEVYGDAGSLVATAPGMVQFGGIQLCGAQRRVTSQHLGTTRDDLDTLPLPREAVNVGRLYQLLGRQIDGAPGLVPDFTLAAREHAVLAAIAHAPNGVLQNFDTSPTGN